MKKYFITGLVILFPVIITLAVIFFLMNILTRPFVGLVQEILIENGLKNISFFIFTGDQIVHFGSQFLILLLLFLFTVILGILTRWFFIKSLFRFGDYMIHRIPVVNTLYKTSQEVIKTVFDSRLKSFEQVVMVPFPNTSTYSIGFISRQAPVVCSNAINHKLTSVFVPTTPNPTSGYLLMYKEDELIFLDMSIEDAIKFIISCGVIHPEIDLKRTIPSPELEK